MDRRPEILNNRPLHPSDRALLRAGEEHSIEAIADVRRRPASRRHPQFNSRALEVSLADVGIDYVPFGDELGGLRRPRSEGDASSLGGALAAYARHMAGEKFAAGLARLEDLARRRSE